VSGPRKEGRVVEAEGARGRAGFLRKLGREVCSFRHYQKGASSTHREQKALVLKKMRQSRREFDSNRGLNSIPDTIGGNVSRGSRRKEENSGY